MAETRYCSNCREELPRHAEECPACGVYAGDLFDGVFPQQRAARKRRLIVLGVILVAVVAVIVALRYIDMQWPPRRVAPAVEPPSTRVVGDRPGVTRRGTGAAISEAEAIRILRRHLTSGANALANDCVVLMSNGYVAPAYVITAFDRCENTRLGRWKVDARTREVSR